MANTIQSNGSITFAASEMQVIGNTSNLYTMTGSNISANIQNIAVGSWQGLDTGSLSDIRFAYISNDGSGSVNISTDSGGSNVIAILQPLDWAYIPWSGSSGLYARAYTNPAVLTTIIAEA